MVKYVYAIAQQEVGHTKHLNTKLKMFMVAQFYQSCLYLTLFLSHFLSVFFFQLVQILNKNVFSCHQLINAQYFCDCPSNPSSVLGMSKISANNGGSRMKVQFVRSQSR